MRSPTNYTLRGGSWYATPMWVRSTARLWRQPDSRYLNVGFRLISSFRLQVQHSKSPWRVIRGGSWFNKPWDVRSAYRYRLAPDDRYSHLGFRLIKGNTRR
jgi:formylglycine-generating enzyme required for sulfatase activity